MPSYSYDQPMLPAGTGTLSASSPAFQVASLVALAFGLAMCMLTCLIRRAVRMRDNIPAACCAGIDDFFFSCCCMCCVQAQIMRHEGLVGSRYKLVTSDGIAATMV